MRGLNLYRLFLIGLILLTNNAFAQQITEFSQYLNNNYLINPAATNISNYLNLDFSVRKQESNRINDVSSYYMSVYGTIKSPILTQKMSNGFRLTRYVDNSTIKAFNPKPIPVIGAVISKDNFGLLEKTTAHITTGIHLPLSARYSLSTAATIGQVRLNVSDDYFILEDNDLPFNQFITSFNKEKFLDLGLGIWFYSDQLQLGYGIKRLFSGNSSNQESEDGFKIKNQHLINAGYKFTLNSDWQLISSLLYRVSPYEKNTSDYSMKLIFKENLWTTLSLRKEKILVFNLGLKLNDSISFSYSYDHGSKNQGTESLSANEIAFQFSTSKSKKQSSIKR